MPEPKGPKESHERSAQQAERVAGEIIEELVPVLEAGTKAKEELTVLKGRINSLMTDKLQNLDSHTKKTARNKIEELLTRKEHIEKLPPILQKMRGVVLEVNGKDKEPKAPASGEGYKFGVPESIKPENLGFWGHVAWAGGIVAVLAYLFGKTKEGANKAWEWTKKVIGLGLIGIGAFLGVKTWAEFQKHKDDLLKAKQAAADALAHAQDATRRLAEGIEGPRKAVELLRVSRAYERIENELKERGMRGGGAKAQADLNTQVFPILKGKQDLQEKFFKEIQKFPQSFRSRNDIRLEFTIAFTPDKGFEVTERMADVDERLALAEAAQGLFGIYANKNDKNYLAELNNSASGMRMDRLVRDRVIQLVHDAPAIRALTIAELKPLAECTTLQECLAKNKAVFDKLPEPTNVESQIALWFLAKSLARRRITETRDGNLVVTQYPGLAEQFGHRMTINSQYIDTDAKLNGLTVVQLLDHTGQYLRLTARMHNAAGDRDIDARTVAPVFGEVFAARKTFALEALSPTVRRSLSRLPVKGMEDLFMEFCAQHGGEYLTQAITSVRGDAKLSPEQKDLCVKAVQELQQFTKNNMNYWKFCLKNDGKPLSSDANASAKLESVLNNLRLADTVQLFLYFEEAKVENGRIPAIPLRPQEHGHFLLHYKVMELMSRVDPAVASEMYNNFIK